MGTVISYKENLYLLRLSTLIIFHCGFSSRT